MPFTYAIADLHRATQIRSGAFILQSRSPGGPALPLAPPCQGFPLIMLPHVNHP
jgi:hypothetical protein